MVGIVVIIAIAGVVSLVRGWIYPGPYHREIVKAKDEDLAESRRREAAKDDTIAIQARTISENNVNNQLVDHVLRAIRDAVESRGGDSP